MSVLALGVQFYTRRIRARSNWFYVVCERVDGVLMDSYAAITDDYGTLVRVDSGTTPPFVIRPGDGS